MSLEARNSTNANVGVDTRRNSTKSKMSLNFRYETIHSFQGLFNVNIFGKQPYFTTYRK